MAATRGADDDAQSSIIAYLVGELAPAHIERLYDEQPYTCLSVFRSLPELEKQYVYRLLYCDTGGSMESTDDNGSSDVHMEVVSSFINEKYGSRHRAALDMLSRSRVLVRGAGVYRMHGGFRRHLQRALGCGVGAWLREGASELEWESGRKAGGKNEARAPPSQDVVDAHAWGQWEKVLMFAIGEEAGEGEGDCGTERGARFLGGSSGLDLRRLMLAAGVVRDADGGNAEERRITERGFQFLLADTHTQVWVVLKEYIRHASTERSREVFDALVEFLLRLGFQKGERVEVGETAQGKEICADLCALGLLYPMGKTAVVPTKLAVILSSGAGGVGPSASASSASASSASSASSARTIEEDRFVIVETNYRVYAYTSSPLKQAILRLFLRTEVLLANLLVGTITRESVVSALDSGITADQIIGYLTQHAHKRVLGRMPIVPDVVSDSIRLWQRELRRMETEEAVLYKNFESPALYKQVTAFIVGIGADLCVDDAKKEVVAAATAHERIKDKIKELKEHMGG